MASDRALQLVKDALEAADALSWMGSRDPADRPYIQQDYDEARENLLKFITLMERRVKSYEVRLAPHPETTRVTCPMCHQTLTMLSDPLYGPLEQQYNMTFLPCACPNDECDVLFVHVFESEGGKTDG